MSNPSVCFLSNTTIHGVYFGIEDNLGESIHLHYGQFRVSMSVCDFLIFAEHIIDAAKELFSLRGLSWQDFDENSFKEEWLVNYASLTKLTKKEMALGDLYMKESFIEKRSIKRIIPLRESGYIRLLQEESNDINYYKEKGQYEPSRYDKLFAIKDKIGMKGYPFDNKLILVDQDGYILDGVKRASYLYYRYGGKKHILVMQIGICWNRSMEERRKSAEVEIASYLAGKEKESPVEKKKDIQKRYAFREIIENIKETNMSFFVIRRKKKTQEKKNIFAEIVITKGALKEFKMRTTLLESQYHPYEKYIYIYAVERPAAYDTTDGIVIVSEQICVKSKFKKQFVPVEKKVDEWLRKNVFFSDTEGFPLLNQKAMLVIILLDCLLEKEVFEESDKLFIENNRDLLDDLDIRQLLRNELFSYTDELVQNIKNADYNAALKGYISYAKY